MLVQNANTKINLFEKINGMKIIHKKLKYLSLNTFGKKFFLFQFGSNSKFSVIN